MASVPCATQVVPQVQLGKNGMGSLSAGSVKGFSASVAGPRVAAVSAGKTRVTCMATEKKADRWAGLGNDYSDDQQDITRGKGMVDSAFQGGWGQGTHAAVLSSYDYISQGQRNLGNITTDGLYISPSFMDKLVVHLCKNFMKLPNIKVPLILGIWGGKGQGKSFQCELVFAKMGINPIMMSAGELESGNAGEPAKLIRQRYREASDVIKKGKMCALFINDLDAGAGRMGGSTQYTVNNQMVNATLMNIADNPTNVQMPGVYVKEEIPRVPIIVTGNDFSTLYAPLIRDGRMEKFYWAPTREDRIGVCTGIFREDKVNVGDITVLVDTFPGQSIDFFGALRARVYDDLVRDWVNSVGIDQMGKQLVNSRSGPPKFEKPSMTLDVLLQYGHMLVAEQENVKRVQLADAYLSGAALGDANKDAIETGSFDGSGPRKSTPTPPPPSSNGASSGYAPPAPKAAAPAPSNGAVQAANVRGLESMSLGELRALARSKGVRGDTKAELIKALSSAPASAAPAGKAAPSASAPSGGARYTKAQLQGKTMGELRALAGPLGIRGDTKAELIASLSK